MAAGIGEAIHDIKTHWKDGKTLKEIAHIHGIDPGNLSRAFRTKEGMTVKAFITGKRKKYVLKTLSTSEVFGYEIGNELGFPSHLAFYQWTKRAFGVRFSCLAPGIRDKEC